MSTTEIKDQIINLIGQLFSDINADEVEQVDALSEIESECQDRITVLNEQIRQRASEESESEV